jgi:hypothetical protein
VLTPKKYKNEEKNNKNEHQPIALFYLNKLDDN